jgi:hypothetical protein
VKRSTEGPDAWKRQAGAGIAEEDGGEHVQEAAELRLGDSIVDIGYYAEGSALRRDKHQSRRPNWAFLLAREGLDQLQFH